MISSSVQARATIATEEVIVLLSGSTSDVVVFRRALGNLEGLSGDDNVRGVCCTTPFLAIWMLLVRYSTTLMASNLPIHAMTERCHVRFALVLIANCVTHAGTCRHVGDILIIFCCVSDEFLSI